MAEIEQLSIKDVAKRVHGIANLLDVASASIDSSIVGVDITDEETTALIVGAICALCAVDNFFLGDLDEEAPDAVRNARAWSDARLASHIISTGAQTYYNAFVSEVGDEQ